MSDYIPVNVPLVNGNEMRYLDECIRSGWISSEGPFVERFERAFAARVGRRHAIAVCNGSAALDAALCAVGVSRGDEVITPALMIISCAAAIVRNGGTPVLVDSDAATWNMRVDEVAARITSRTKAILLAHTYGLPVDVDPILELAADKGLTVVEDAAEMHGQTYKGRCCGTLGNISTFSFYPNKHITTGEGGMILTDEPAVAERCRSLRNLCFGEGMERFIHTELGWNFRMSNLQAAVGVAQLERLDDSVRRKREIGGMYRARLADIDALQLPLAHTSYAENIYWVFGIVLRDDVPFAADEMIARLHAQGVGARPFFYPMHRQPVFRSMGLFRDESYPVAENLARRGLYIPSGLGLSNQQIETVAETVRKVLA